MTSVALRDSNRTARYLLGGFVMLLATVVVTVLLLQRTSTRAAALAGTLSRETMPTIEHMAKLHDATVGVQLALSERVHNEPGATSAAAHQSVAELKRIVEPNAGSPSPPLSPVGTVLLMRFEQSVDRTLGLLDQDAHAARAVFDTEVMPAAEQFEGWEMREIALHAQTSAIAASDLQTVRSRMLWLSYSCVAIVVLLGVVATATLRNRAKRQIDALGAYARNQETRAQDSESRADEMEQFAGRVAHDIRSPLSSASLAAELLDQQLEAANERSVVARLQRSLKRAAAITDGLLEFARAGARPEPGARTNVKEAIDDIVDGLSMEVSQAGIELRVDPVPAVYVPCSPGVFASVFGNLVRNAMKYMGERDERRITVRVLETTTGLRTFVSDTGPGIAKEVQQHLFEPYFRVGGSSQVGLGLGLATVRKLVEGHGGSVDVDSSPGHGSTFWFELPYASISRPRPSNITAQSAMN